MKIKRKLPTTKMPEKSHLPDVGLDIFIPQDFEIESFETKTLPLELYVQIPEGFAGMLVPRSSVAAQGLIIQTSIIDPDYTGEIHLIVTNCSKETKRITKGARLCSLVVYSTLNARLEEVEYFESTERGTDGLGSSGI